VLMVSSYLPELFGMCDRLAVMSRGRLSKSNRSMNGLRSRVTGGHRAADLHG
jgi:ABC-type sugar transport system ATPase subunit